MRTRPLKLLSIPLLLLVSLAIEVSGQDQQFAQPETNLAAVETDKRNETAGPPKIVLVIHGGSGVLNQEEMDEIKLKRSDFEKALGQALVAGFMELAQGKTSVDAVETSIRLMEDSELFNAGRGGAFSNDGRVALDASIMEGLVEGKGDGKKDPRKRAGAVAAVTHVKNPISAARAVMEMSESKHVLLVGEDAEVFVLNDANRHRYRIERVSNLYFWTDRRVNQIRGQFAKDEKAKSALGKQGASIHREVGNPPGGADQRFGTVGAVALDGRNHLAAGTSTGGVANKLAGRVGDSPLIGSGTYVDDRACGVSCTGTGEVFIRHAVAHDVIARMLYSKNDVEKAVSATINELPDEEGGVGGLIALDHQGRHAFGMSPKADGMYRGYITETGKIYVALFANDEMKEIKVDQAADGKK